MTEVLLSFDTEDYTAPGSDDAILALSEILQSQKVRGCFNVVAELARILADRHRKDIMESLGYHEIDYHSRRHSHHPTIAEYCDSECWDAGWERFMEEESQGIDIVKSVFQRDHLWAAVPPGNCISAQAIYGYPTLGIPIYSGSLFKGTGGRGIWFCNALNLENNCAIDDLLLREGIQGVKRKLESWKALDRLIVCCHPNIIIYKEFWDRLNFDGGNPVVWGDWKIPEKRDDQVIRIFYEDFQAFLEILRISPDFSFTTNEEIWSGVSNSERTITKRLLLRLLDDLDTRFETGCCGAGKLIESRQYSLAEVFKASVSFLLGADEYEPENLRGFLREPAGVSERTVLPRSALLQAAKSLKGVSSIPERIEIGGTHIGPRDFLDAAKQVLAGEESVILVPKNQMPAMSGFYRFEDFQLKGTWIYPKNFQGRWVTKLLRLQSWTIRMERLQRL